ncbi:MAG TPA: hypothetical protein DIS66_05195 [Candidatus Omnitrophica bacterium]|mgnify:CR=1 FL=1|nr:hypothetical protein [Candidatus Omnitrophota bacterium]
MLQILFAVVFGSFFLYKGIKGIREKRFTYKKKKFLGKTEEVTYEGASALFFSWLYAILGFLFICSPALRILSAPRVVY